LGAGEESAAGAAIELSGLAAAAGAAGDAAAPPSCANAGIAIADANIAAVRTVRVRFIVLIGLLEPGGPSDRSF